MKSTAQRRLRAGARAARLAAEQAQTDARLRELEVRIRRNGADLRRLNRILDEVLAARDAGREPRLEPGDLLFLGRHEAL